MWGNKSAVAQYSIMSEGNRLLLLYMMDLNNKPTYYGGYPPFMRGLVAIRFMLRKRLGLDPSNGKSY